MFERERQGIAASMAALELEIRGLDAKRNELASRERWLADMLQRIGTKPEVTGARRESGAVDKVVSDALAKLKAQGKHGFGIDAVMSLCDGYNRSSVQSAINSRVKAGTLHKASRGHWAFTLPPGAAPGTC